MLLLNGEPPLQLAGWDHDACFKFIYEEPDKPIDASPACRSGINHIPSCRADQAVHLCKGNEPINAFGWHDCADSCSLRCENA